LELPTGELLPPPQAAIPSTSKTSTATLTIAGRKRSACGPRRASDIMPASAIRPSSSHRTFPPSGGRRRDNGRAVDAAVLVTVTLILVGPVAVTEDETLHADSDGAPLQARLIAWSRPSSGVRVRV
jgi:hypothetical protein